jgi:hypothetical protein
MKMKLFGLVAACALFGAPVAANASPYVVTLEEVGSNVVATGSGAIDTTGLLLFQSGGSFFSVVDPSSTPDFIFTGAGSYALYLDPAGNGPSSFGSGGETVAASGSGGYVGINCFGYNLCVPAGYISDSPLSDSALYNNATFASLGVTPGTYVWTWGTGADQSFTLEIGTTPLPAALPLFVTGLGAIGLLGWRRNRKNAAAIAA